jgi:para-nitrobenzyl esterase
MKLRGTLVIVLMLACLACSGQSNRPQTITESGAVSGVREGDVVVYKGIPFAAPPVGPLRWRAPQPVHRWSDVLQSDKYKPQCMQNWPPLPTMPAEAVSEDCLYLKVWTQAADAKEKRPVMVWVHGGGFRRLGVDTFVLGQ